MTDELNAPIERVLSKGILSKINSPGGQAFMPTVQLHVQCLILEELQKLNGSKKPKKEFKPHQIGGTV